MSHSLIITLLPSSFNVGIKIENTILEFDDIKLSGSLFVCSNMMFFFGCKQEYVLTCHETENRCLLVAVVIKIEQH